MLRDIDELTGRTFDVLVVGGGIYGLTIACDAAQRGLAVALVEREDFGSGSSFNHLRTIHGGLRYLQTLDLPRARESVRERRTLARIAPHAVRPLPFAMPLYRSFTRGKLALRAGFMLDRFVAGDRNSGVPAPLWLPAGHVVSRYAAIERFPGLPRRGLTGAAVWFDYVMPEPDRLTFAWARAAADHGAVLANHLEAVAPLVDGRRVTGMRASDRLGRGEIEIAARLVVNATGAGVDRILQPLGAPTRMPLLTAMNLVTLRDAGEEALGGRGRSGRNLFLVPWRKRALFGTWESRRVTTADEGAITEAEIGGFIAELNEAFPSLDLTRADVTLIHHGIVPATIGANGSVALEGRERLRDHAGDGIEGLISIAGTKYTTARAAAERITDRIIAKLQLSAVSCRTATTKLPGGELRDVAETIAEARRDYDVNLPSDTIPHLVAAYGSRYRDVLAMGGARPDLLTRLAHDSPVIGAQLVWAVRHEMAITLSDAVLRRTPLGALGYPGDEAARRAADIIGAELGWSDARKVQELSELKRFYAIR
jgi:glycerol-3-phosphate dehydrogenase